MIEIKNISIKTRHNILKKISYTFEDGMIYGIVAINGSGKTTFFRTLVNLIQQSEGQITFDRKNIDKIRKNVFYYESCEWLDKNLSGMDYLQFVSKMWKSDNMINEIIEYWGMEEYIKLPIKKYSLGMKQRLIISMYQLSDTKFMIMDELTNGLDEDNRKKMFQFLLASKEQGKLVLLSSHYGDEIKKYCDVIVKIKDCSLVEEFV